MQAGDASDWKKPPLNKQLSFLSEPPRRYKVQYSSSLDKNAVTRILRQRRNWFLSWLLPRISGLHSDLKTKSEQLLGLERVSRLSYGRVIGGRASKKLLNLFSKICVGLWN